MLCLFLVGLDSGVVNVILPQLRTEFDISMAQSTLLATAYIATLAAFQLFFGRLADLFGAARLFLTGILLFGAGSLGCAMAGSFGLMLLARALQGIGGAMLSASFGAIVMQSFPKEQRGRVMGGAMLVFSLGALVGPPLGGFLAEHASWRWAFSINVPGCLLAAWALTLALSCSHTQPWRGRLDPAGSLLSALVLLTLPAGLHHFSLPPSQRGPGYALIALGVVAAMLFLVAERRCAHPLVDLQLFRDSSLMALFGYKLLLFGALNGITVVFPFFIVAQPGMDVADAGLVMLFSAISMAVLTPLAGRQVDRSGSYRVLLAGALAMAMAALGSLALGPRPAFWALALAMAALGGAASIGMVPSSVAVLEGAPKGQEGVFSALNSLVSPIGGSLGLSLFSLVYGSDAAASQDFRGLRDSLLTVLICAVGMGLLARAYEARRRA